MLINDILSKNKWDEIRWIESYYHPTIPLLSMWMRSSPFISTKARLLLCTLLWFSCTLRDSRGMSQWGRRTSTFFYRLGRGLNLKLSLTSIPLCSEAALSLTLGCLLSFSRLFSEKRVPRICQHQSIFEGTLLQPPRSRLPSEWYASYNRYSRN